MKNLALIFALTVLAAPAFAAHHEEAKQEETKHEAAAEGHAAGHEMHVSGTTVSTTTVDEKAAH